MVDTPTPPVPPETPVTPPVPPAPAPAAPAVPPVVSVIDKPNAVSDALVTPEPVQEYRTYGDPTADSIIETLKNAKVPPSKAAELFSEAVKSGDVSKVDKAQLTKLLGKDAAELTVMRLEKALADNRAKVDATVKIVHDAVGGKENWEKVITWAKSQTDAEFVKQFDAYRSMLNLGSVQAGLAAEALKKAYEAGKNNSSLQVKIVQGDKAASASVGDDDKTLTRSKYVELLKVANKEGNTAEVQRLGKIRIASMQAGVL